MHPLSPMEIIFMAWRWSYRKRIYMYMYVQSPHNMPKGKMCSFFVPIPMSNILCQAPRKFCVSICASLFLSTFSHDGSKAPTTIAPFGQFRKERRQSCRQAGRQARLSGQTPIYNWAFPPSHVLSALAFSSVSGSVSSRHLSGVKLDCHCPREEGRRRKSGEECCTGTVHTFSCSTLQS